MSDREWTPREKAIRKGAKLIMVSWGIGETTPRAQREEVWLEARSIARALFDMADSVGQKTVEQCLAEKRGTP